MSYRSNDIGHVPKEVISSFTICVRNDKQIQDGDMTYHIDIIALKLGITIFCMTRL
jgi:hypothetical protein